MYFLLICIISILLFSKVKVLFAFSRGGQHGADETNKLLTILGAQEHDKQVLFIIIPKRIVFSAILSKTSLCKLKKKLFKKRGEGERI